MKPIAIGTRREFFWDDTLVDTAQTTATFRLHPPQRREVVMVHDAPWEGDGCNYHCIVKDVDRYRLYYLAWQMLDPDVTPDVINHRSGGIVVAYAESRDGLSWVKPDLGIREFKGSRANNILLNETDVKLDNFFVFLDPRSDCPASQRYKGVAVDASQGVLWCFSSSDGIHFERAWPMTDRGVFDSLNTALWDRHRQCYRCYIRDFHPATEPAVDGPGEARSRDPVRDIRWMESEDFKDWSVPQQLGFGEAPDVPLYTNAIQPYYRGDHVFVGFPTRYVQRTAWTPNYDQLPDAERRRKQVAIQPRYGLALSDCVFMCSRDGRKWNRCDEAFMTPGPERVHNWVYGDCYPAVGMIETASHLPGAPNELSMYAKENHWSGMPAELRRYSLRVDGFASRHGACRAQRLVTKPFVYAGKELSINFATSAAGSVRLRLRAEDRALTSCELFGDSLDRRVAFAEGDASTLAGRPVVMEMDLSDADIYSFRFLDEGAETERGVRDRSQRV